MNTQKYNIVDSYFSENIYKTENFQENKLFNLIIFENYIDKIQSEIVDEKKFNQDIFRNHTLKVNKYGKRLPCNIQQLPEELVKIIFEFSSKDWYERDSYMLVSKAFYKVFKPNLQMIEIGKFTEFVDPENSIPTIQDAVRAEDDERPIRKIYRSNISIPNSLSIKNIIISDLSKSYRGRKWWTDIYDTSSRIEDGTYKPRYYYDICKTHSFDQQGFIENELVFSVKSIVNYVDNASLLNLYFDMDSVKTTVKVTKKLVLNEQTTQQLNHDGKYLIDKARYACEKYKKIYKYKGRELLNK